MRFLRPALAALLLGACAPALVAPSFGQECVCPPAEGATAGPIIESDETPPPMPDYDQPPMPTPGDIWTPGYWAWNNDDYYWVPGVWVEPPQPGLLWTPGYWAFVGGVYLFHRGYWAPHVGFYGGVHYGYGYNGLGYEGGRWENGRFFYNTTVNNFGSVRLVNVYSQPVAVPPGAGRASYNGGPGGNLLKPTPEQERLSTEPRVPATPAQRSQVRAASVNPEQFDSTNKGKPAIAATPRPGELKGPGAVPAKAPGAALAVPTTGPAGQPPAPNAEKPNAQQKLPAEKPLGALPAQPAQPLNEAKPAEKLPPREKPLGEAPVKPEPLNVPKAQENLPAGEAAPGKKPPVPEKRKQLEKPQGMIEKPQGFEKPPGAGPAPGAAAKAQEKLPARAMDGGSPKPPGLERPIGPALAPKAVPKGPPGVAERKPPRPEDKKLACGRPGLPPCPK